MTTKLRRAALAALSCALTATAAHAAVIFDTGPGDSSNGFAFLAPFQYIGGQFTTSGPVTLGAAQGWMQARGGSIDVVVYGDDGNLPDLGNELLRHSFALPTTVDFEWVGPCALPPLNLPAGTYWITWEADDGDADLAIGAPAPLAWYGTAIAPTFAWWSYDDGGFGFRAASSCEAFETAVTPVPALSLAPLAGLACLLGGVAAFRLGRRKRP